MPSTINKGINNLLNGVLKYQTSLKSELVPLFREIGIKVFNNELSIAQEHTLSAIFSFHIGQMIGIHYQKKNLNLLKKIHQNKVQTVLIKTYLNLNLQVHIVIIKVLKQERI